MPGRMRTGVESRRPCGPGVRLAPERARELRAPVLGAAITVVMTLGCELTEVTIAAPEDVIVAETLLVLELDPSGDGVTLDALAYLHRTQNLALDDEVADASVRVSGASGGVVQLAEQDGGALCLRLPGLEGDTISEERYGVGSCYRTRVSPSRFAPGELLELEIVIPDGRVLTAVSRVPGAFAFQGLAHEDGSCRLEPDTNYRFEWTQAEDTWAYLADARIEGLPEALADRDPEVPDSLYLLGLSIGREDTEIVFPREFGFFDYFDEDYRDLVRALQDGMPDGSRALISFAATDRNWTNWVRGGNFNPSGQVRIPSVFGEGTGWFGTATQRRVHVTVSNREDGRPPLCGPAEPAERTPVTPVTAPVTPP